MGQSLWMELYRKEEEEEEEKQAAGFSHVFIHPHSTFLQNRQFFSFLFFTGVKKKVTTRPRHQNTLRSAVEWNPVCMDVSGDGVCVCVCARALVLTTSRRVPDVKRCEAAGQFLGHPRWSGLL